MELVPIEAQVIGSEKVNCVSARELWKFLGVATDFSDWIKRRLEETEAVLDKDYLVLRYKDENPKGLTATPMLFAPIEYYVVLDVAKHMAMLERSEKGRQIRQYFIDVEKRARLAVGTPQTYLEALEALVKQVKFSSAQERVIEAQEELLQLQAPAKEFVDKFVSAKGLYNLRLAAKSIGLYQNDFIDRCAKLKIIFKERGRWTASSEALKAGYMTTKNGIAEHSEHAFSQALFTPGGLVWVAARLGLLLSERQINSILGVPVAA